METTKDLAGQVIEMLDGQREYFTARRTKSHAEAMELLRESKSREQALRQRCQEILQPARQGTLFQEPKTGVPD